MDIFTKYSALGLDDVADHAWVGDFADSADIWWCGRVTTHKELIDPPSGKNEEYVLSPRHSDTPRCLDPKVQGDCAQTPES